MVSWSEFESAAPLVASRGRELLYRSGDGEALIASVRANIPPRIHPVNVGIVDGRLWVFVIDRSPKARDLATDGRYALHSHMDPAAPDEFEVRGRATLADAEAVRSTVASEWYFEVDDGYRLFELAVESALLGLRGPDEWPPRYQTWAV